MDSFLKYIEFVPAYIIDLISLLSSPKTFLKSRNRGDENWPTALRFFGFSAILVFILLQFANNRSLVVPKDELLMDFAKLIVFWGAFILFGAAVIKVSWKFVGGKASFDSTLLTHIYSFSMLLLIVMLVSLISKGILQNIFVAFIISFVLFLLISGMLLQLVPPAP